TLSEDYLDPRIGGGIGFGRVLHRGKERHRELGDEADLHRLLRHGRSGERCRSGKRKPSHQHLEFHSILPIASPPARRLPPPRPGAANSQVSAPTISETSSCWLARLGLSSPTLLPWRSTTARSASSTTCSMLWVMRITAFPSALSWPMRSRTLRDSRSPSAAVGSS